MQLARAISEFTSFPPNEASIATLERRLNPQYWRRQFISWGTVMTTPPTVDDKALAAVDSEWRTAREIYAIIDQGASTVGAVIRLADVGKIERRRDIH
jgi:hypothetical protein